MPKTPKRPFLFAFSGLYNAITGIRNTFYNNQIFKSYAPPIPVVCIGNLSVGGTGKSPHVEHAIRLLGDEINIATLSRGYGRKTKGFLEICKGSSPTDVGDEPLQIYMKFADKIRSFVCEDRIAGVTEIQGSFPECDLVIMDDGFQHRKIKAGKYIILTDFSQPFFDDYLLPGGDLRESRNNADRADLVIVTKAPLNLSDDTRATYQEKINRYTNSKVIFSSIAYGEPITNDGKEICRQPVVAITGIAKPTPFIEYVNQLFDITKHFNFSDHHNFSTEEIHKILEYAEEQGCNTFICTEKDFAKLNSIFQSMGINKPLVYIPIQMQFSDMDETIFKQTLLSALNK